MKAFALVASTAAALTLTAPASAAAFFDNFDNETPAAPAGTLANFQTYGTVDVVNASNPYGITVSGPASGNVIDVDGTPGPGGILSTQSFNFAAGQTVTLSFDVGGSQRGGQGDNFYAGFLFGANTGYSNFIGTGLFSGLSGGSGTAPYIYDSVFIPGTTGFTSSTISFLANDAGSLQFGFGTDSQDNIGPLLDNVGLSIAGVPEPSTWALMILGFGAIGGALRRRARQSVRYNFA